MCATFRERYFAELRASDEVRRLLDQDPRFARYCDARHAYETAIRATANVRPVAVEFYSVTDNAPLVEEFKLRMVPVKRACTIETPTPNSMRRTFSDDYYAECDIPELHDRGAYNKAFTWCDAKPNVRHADADLERVARFLTFHSYAYHGFFKPTLAEVIVQTPVLCLDALRRDVTAKFYIHTDTVEPLNCTILDDVHVAVTTLYATKQKDARRTQ
jgi:hypothetical protein